MPNQPQPSSSTCRPHPISSPAPRRGRTPSTSRPPNPPRRSRPSRRTRPRQTARRTAPSLNVPFADYFDVDPFGAEPVRGSGCGLDTPIGDELPDGLWRGYVRSFDGLWVDAATSLEFDVACVYAGDAGTEAGRDRRDDQLVEESVEVPDGYLVNNNDRVRTVRLGASFVQVDAQWNDAGQCVPPGDIAAVGGDPALPAARFVVARRERRGTLGGDRCPGDPGFDLTRSLRCAPLSPFGRVSWSGFAAPSSKRRASKLALSPQARGLPPPPAPPTESERGTPATA